MRARGPHHAIGLYAHLTWHTWRRQRLVTEQDVIIVIAAVQSAAGRTLVRIHSVAVLADHVHLVVSYSPRTRLSDFVREAKSESARRTNEARGSVSLRWCRGYYANSLSRTHVTAARQYVARQYQRHPDLHPLRVG